MTTPPTGTVTFLFTDVEGSTRQASADAAAWSVALARHKDIVRAAVSDEDGFVFQVIGDACFAAFPTAGRAVAAALSAQRMLRAEQWPAARVTLRMGLHTGPAEWQNDDYEGYLTLVRTQRLMGVGHGGQVLLSRAAADLAMSELPSDVALRDLGEHWLKDLPNSEHLFQLVAPDLPADFPPLRSHGAERSNLPAQLTSFIGRERELAELRALLSSNRLLTLTGPGGTGKTRLALQLATEVLETFGAGAWLVELGSVFDPELVPQTVAATLGVREQPGRTVLDSLRDYVRNKDMLLILDNCEHLIGASASLADALLRIAPGLTVLATSRESLGITGETAFRAPPMTVPGPHEPPADLDRLADNECVRLFVDRASAADPRFRLVERNAAAVGEICRRLDGIPLAIELAAARIKVFPAEQIAARLDDRFRLLTGGSRTALERHQTLKALIDWSHDLLSEPELVLLRRLSVFAGGWSQQAAHDVCDGALPDGTVETIARLADKSMVVIEGSFESAEGRYRMLETIRQYARDKLLASGESEQVRDRHMEYFLRFAEAAEPKLRGSEQLPWLDRVEMEQGNLRVALEWSLESGNSDRALRLVGALAYFWELRGDWTVPLGWAERALSSSGPEQSEAAQTRDDGEPSSARPTDTIKARRAKALYGLGRLRFAAGEAPVSRTMVEEALQSWRELGDTWWMAVALEHIGFMLRLEGDFETSVARLEEGVSLARGVEDRWPLARCLVRLAGSFLQTDPAAAVRLYEEGVAIARSVGDRSFLSEGLVGLAGALFLGGNLAASAPIAAEALTEARAIGSVTGVFLSLLGLAVLRCMQGDQAGAEGYCLELLALGRQTGSPAVQLIGVFARGFVACLARSPQRGVRMLAASQALAGQRGMSLGAGGGGGFNLLSQMAIEKARSQLEGAAFDEAMREGQALTLDQAFEVATEE
jgi:predicted ATPase/class 3 adenylate cyclase